MDYNKLIKIKSFQTEEGFFDVYDIEKNPIKRAAMFTVFKDKDGWIIRNALIPLELQRKGIATKFYVEMNKMSIKKTGNPLRSTQKRILSNGEIVHELSEDGIFFWESLVEKGYAKKIDNKNYVFMKNKYSNGGELLLAPNGKPSNLTPEQYKLVRTPAFKKWFGDWENSPETASKVVDENGEPLVCYHGTNREFNVFNINAGSAHDLGYYGRGFYFTFNTEGKWMKYAKDEASYYGSIIKEFFIKSFKPFDFSSLSEYKGVKISYIGAESIVFLMNLAIKFPELSEKIELAQNKWNEEKQDYDVNYLPISVLPELIDNYSKMLKTSIVEDNYGEKKISGYVKSEVIEYDYTSSGGKKGSYNDIDTLGIFDSKMNPKEIEILFIVEAIKKYDGIDVSYYPEGYMTRFPEITDLIKKEHDSIVQSKYGDEIVAFEPNQIKLADGTNTTFDSNNPDIRYADGGIINNENFKKWFDDSYFKNDDGNPIIFYHETKAENLPFIKQNGFDTNLVKSRGNDNLLPDGVFLKDNDKEIGVGGKGDKVQISVYISAKNVLTFRNRNNFYNFLKDESRDFYDAYWASELYDKEMSRIFDTEIWGATKNIKYERGTEEWKKFYEEWDKKSKEFLDNWGNETARLSKISRKLATDILIDKNIQAIVIENDEGSFGRNVYTVVVLNPFNIKSVNNLGTFDRNEKGIIYAKGGELSEDEKKQTYKKWKELVNMSASELKSFMDSDEGKVAGLSKKEANELGIHYGRESAKWILKMKETSVKDWTSNMWRWAKRQISFNSRMRGNKGKLYDEKGKKTRKHLSLLIWGHNPEK